MADPTVTKAPEGLMRGTNFNVNISDADGLSDASFNGLTQAWEISFERKWSRIYDLSDSYFAYVEYPPEGQLTLSRVVGPAGTQKLACECTPKNIVLTPGKVACITPTNAQMTNGFQTFTMGNAMPFGFKASGSIQDWLVAFSQSYVFSSLR